MYSLQENMEKYGTDGQAKDDNVIWRVCFTCWITMDTHTHTHTHRMWNTYCLSTAKVVTPTRLNVTLRLSCFTEVF